MPCASCGDGDSAGLDADEVLRAPFDERPEEQQETKSSHLAKILVAVLLVFLMLSAYVGFIGHL